MQLQEQTSRERASSRTAQAAGIAVTLGLTLLFLFLGYARGTENLGLMNADSLYGYLFLQDLVKEGGSFQWFLQPANSFFPDLIFLALAKLLSGSLDATYSVYSSFLFPFLFLSLVMFLRSAGLPWTAASLVAACVVVFALFFRLRTTGMTYLFTVPAHHATATALTLLGAGAALRATRNAKSRWSVLLSALLIGGMFSDLILLVQLVAPLTAYSSGRLLLFQGQDRRESLTLLAIVWLSSGLGATLRSLLGLIPGIVQPGLESVGGGLTASLLNFTDQLPAVVKAFTPAVSLASALGLLLSLFVLDRWLLLKKPRIDGLVILALCSWAAFLGPFAAGTWVGAAVIRQQLPTVIAPACLLALACYLRLSGRPALGRTLLVAMSIFITLSAAFILKDFQESERPTAFPTYKRAAGQIGISEGDFLLVEYWKAKPLLAVTRQSACSVHNDFSVMTWIMNLDWCREGFENWRQVRGRLIVALNSRDPTPIEAHFGQPLGVVETEVGTFLLYGWTAETDERVRRSICRSYAANAPARAPAFCQ